MLKFLSFYLNGIDVCHQIISMQIVNDVYIPVVSSLFPFLIFCNKFAIFLKSKTNTDWTFLACLHCLQFRMFSVCVGVCVCVCFAFCAKANKKSHPSKLLDNIQKTRSLGSVIVDDTSSNQHHQQQQYHDGNHDHHHLQSGIEENTPHEDSVQLPQWQLGTDRHSYTCRKRDKTAQRDRHC